jgi:NAD(P)-dependent dehydrogenase (short-subunit alcohol dehydrogenase family)
VTRSNDCDRPRRASPRAARPITLIAGASRGIGRALTRELAKAGHLVVAGCRTTAYADELTTELNCLGGRGVRLDVTDHCSLRSAAASVDEHHHHLDVLVVSAGITHARGGRPEESKGPLGKLMPASMEEVFRTNTIGPMLVLQSFLPLLRRSPTGGVAMVISSDRGSLTCTDAGNSIAYSMSKAAINMGVKKASLSPEIGEVTVFAVHPGWVATELGGQEAPVMAPVAARQLAQLLTAAARDRELHGRFVDPTGNEVPW